VFEDEVRGPAFERLGGHFLAQRTGHKNEGHVGTLAWAMANAEKPSNAHKP
jgi:hypothetical protein